MEYYIEISDLTENCGNVRTATDGITRCYSSMGLYMESDHPKFDTSVNSDGVLIKCGELLHDTIPIAEARGGYTIKITAENVKFYRNGLLHRETGPAYRSRCAERWHKNGKLHRVGGPAYSADIFEWWVDGVLVSSM